MNEIWKQAEEKLDEILKQYAGLSEGEQFHAEGFIFPSAAVYLRLKEIIGKEAAYAVIENAAASECALIDEKLEKMMKIPGMPSLFVKAWGPVTKTMFSNKSGFENRFYDKTEGEYRMDILSCPYCRLMKELGCSELTPVFCDNDGRTYGNLPGLQFSRTSTLAKGADCCDFCVKTVKEEKATMKKQYFDAQRNGFHGVFYPCSSKTNKGMIMMLGDSSDDYMAVTGAKWLNEQGCHVMAMSADKKDYGHHNYPLERIQNAIIYLKGHGCEKIGIVGASTTGMLALAAASYFPDIDLTVALSPSDFIMEGFYQDNKDGMHERPGDNESSLSYEGKPLPYLPYAYRHPEYWQKIEEESKRTGNQIASREMFDESERRHPLQEEEKIKVERIKGKIIFIGAEDDCLWDTCRYIRRMQERLQELPRQSPRLSSNGLYARLVSRKELHSILLSGLIDKPECFGHYDIQ